MPPPTIASKALTEYQRKAWDAVQEHGSIRAAARALGKSYTPIHGAYHAAQRKLEIDPATQSAMAAIGTNKRA